MEFGLDLPHPLRRWPFTPQADDASAKATSKNCRGPIQAGIFCFVGLFKRGHLTPDTCVWYYALSCLCSIWMGISQAGGDWKYLRVPCLLCAYHSLLDVYLRCYSPFCLLPFALFS